MSQAPSMPVFVDALIGDTLHLSAEQFGAYCLLLFATWRNNGRPLTDDNEVLARICRLTLPAWRKMRPTLSQFFSISDGTWRQKRLEQEWDYVTERAKRARENGNLGGRPKRTQDKPNGLPVGTPERTQEQSTHTHSHLEEPIGSPRKTRANPFDEFWEAYPHKIGKGAAEAKFKIALRLVDLPAMLGAIERYKASKPADVAWANPATWLHQKRWLDEPAPPIVSTSAKPFAKPETRSVAQSPNWNDDAPIPPEERTDPEEISRIVAEAKRNLQTFPHNRKSEAA